LIDLISNTTLQSFVSRKFVVRVAFSPTGRFIATASYDHTIAIYEAVSATHSMDEADVLDETDDAALAGDPILRYEQRRTIETETNPESIVFKDDWLLWTTRSSHLLNYIRLPAAKTLPRSEWEIVTKSFNEHPMDDHVSFSVLNLVLDPSKRLVACQTGDHRGSGGERVLIYGAEPEEVNAKGRVYLRLSVWHVCGQGLRVMILCFLEWIGYLMVLGSCKCSLSLPDF
jgi:WD40 repeat protein